MKKITQYFSAGSLFAKGLRNQNRNLIIASVALFAFKKIRKYSSTESKLYKIHPGDTIEIHYTDKKLKQ